MNAGRRTFLENMATRCEERAAARRAAGTRADLVIADVLERMAAGDRAELADASPEPEVITWASPCFRPDGRFDPFAGTWAQRMLASADACERVGAPDVARGYRRLAEQGALPPDEVIDAIPAQPEPSRRRARTVWTGAPIPPPEPAPFVAGEQLGMLL